MFLPGQGSAQRGASGGEWRHYGGDAGSTRYSPLDQIDSGNAGDLEVVWRWKSDNYGPRPEYNYRTTPLMVDGVLYATAGYRRTVVAIGRRHRGDPVDLPARRRGPFSATAQLREGGDLVGVPRDAAAHLHGQPRVPPGGA